MFPQRGVDPPATVAVAWSESIGNGTSIGVGSSAALAWTAAVAAFGSYSGYLAASPGSVPPPENDKFRTTITHYDAQAAKQRYKWVFFTGTCYFKAWWDEVVRYASGASGSLGIGSITGTTNFDWEWTPTSVSGLCVPSGFYVGLPFTDWNESSVYDIAEIEPGTPSGDNTQDKITTTIENVRFSYVDGYAPTNLSDSGFPPP